MKLEDIKKDAVVNGLLKDEVVRVLSVEFLGTNAKAWKRIQSGKHTPDFILEKAVK